MHCLSPYPARFSSQQPFYSVACWLAALEWKLHLVTTTQRLVFPLVAGVNPCAFVLAVGRWEVNCPSNMINAKTLPELDVTVREACTSGRLVVVNFFAPECYACKSMQPKLRQIASSNPDTLFIKVDGFLDEFRGYCNDMGITKIPYFHLYRGNKRVSEFTANMRPEKLALLRAEIAAQKPNRVSMADNVEYQTLEA